MQPPVANEPLLVVDALSVTFNRGPEEVRAVHNVSIRLEHGEILSLAGESGCGKSSVAHALLGLNDHQRDEVGGRIVFQGRGVSTDGPLRFNQVRGSGIALVPQSAMASLTPVHTVGSLVQETLRTHAGMGSRESAARAIELLDEVGLDAPDRVARCHPHELSGGMKQRVAIALALAPQPRLLVADEPTAALDSISQAQILDLIREIRERRGMSVLLITHDLSTIASTADRVAVMRDGIVVESGPVNEVFLTPRQAHTSAFIASRNRPKTPRTTPLDSSPLLSMNGVRVSFSADGIGIGSGDEDRVEALRGANLEIGTAETVALVGGSGSGKTTLARSIVGLVEPTAGSIRFDGIELIGAGRGAIRSVRRRVGLVLQDSASALNPRHSIEKSVATPLLASVRSFRADRESIAQEALISVGLETKHFDRLPHELSGGERQRASLARALVSEPDLLICDEPVSGLDGFAEMGLLELLNDITRETGLACLFITHSFVTARSVADRVAIMYEGEIVESGSFESVFNQPGHPHTEALVRAAGMSFEPGGA